ncbi:aspartate aminotransferase family protein [Acidihalobacter ferrooxydans]|uniref:Aspartate aminotransferase family protein n=1 Tax=Acidihalobacter ferrooxydans TaxID=1765967 RepID=A0A1P8UJZ7_9GAMM|nr:aspartate aminotransferase family protein [Acidihalobacter ferrooxydans]APZ44163.1 aspartate aminotransferase family protein [Acidihalobacter ferrooxydans]
MSSQPDTRHEIAGERTARDAYWMPFTANRQFKDNPRLLVGAEGMHYTTADGRSILDGQAGLWCVNAGHGREPIIEAVQRQIAEMDFAPSFNMGHPLPFEFANRLVALSPGDLDHVFFTNSGSESVDTALKIALAYHRVRGEGHRMRLIGREKGYHGVNFGGTSVGGLVNNRKYFGLLLGGVDHLSHTLDIGRNAFTCGLPEHGAELADELERLVALHGDTIAAVIVEPVAGSAGVILPPKGYLQRLREICDAHGILLIFDEVITGFGRLGAPFAAQYFDVLPDIMTTAKGLTNGSIPMGAVFVRRHVYDAFMQGAEANIELFHGYTYSGHPVAAAAGLATLDVYAEEGLLTRGAELADYWAEKLHALRDLPYVRDIRNLGLIGGIDLEPRPGEAGRRGYELHCACFEKGALVRYTGDIVAMSPPLIVTREQIDELVDILAQGLRELR